MKDSCSNETPTPEMTVKAVIDRWPAAAPVLAARGLDLCCGGAHPLAFAAQAHGVELEPLLRELREVVEARRHGRP